MPSECEVCLLSSSDFAFEITLFKSLPFWLMADFSFSGWVCKVIAKLMASSSFIWLNLQSLTFDQGLNYHFALCKSKWILVIATVKLWMIRKSQSSFIPKENLIHPYYIFPPCIHVLFINCVLLSKEMLLKTKITSENAKNALQFY